MADTTKKVMIQMNGYRIEWTRFVPGGTHSRESVSIRGTLEDVRIYLDSQSVFGRDPIVVVEHTQSDGNGRVVPAEEWDIIDD
jgi:hypothetical protein